MGKWLTVYAQSIVYIGLSHAKFKREFRVLLPDVGECGLSTELGFFLSPFFMLKNTHEQPEFYIKAYLSNNVALQH